MNKEVRAIDLQQIDLMRLQIVLQQGVTAILTNIVISLITALALYSVVPSTFIVFWATLSVFVNSFRLLLLRRIRSKLNQSLASTTVNFYENVYAFSLFLSGLVWGQLGWLFDTDTVLTQQIIIPLVIGGMSAGAIFSHLSSIRCYCAFVLPMILPVSFGIFFSGAPLEATTTLVYLAAVLVLTKNLNKRLVESLLLRAENTNLVQHLTDINQSQAQLLLQLREKEQFLLHTFEQAGVPSFLIDAEFKILDVNYAACHLFGYDKAVIKRLPATELLYPDDSDTVSSQFHRLIKGDINQYTITGRCVNRSGQPLWLHATLSAVRNESDEIEYIVIQAQDITQQYQLSQDLQRQSLLDAITGLPNRQALEQQLQQLLNAESAAEHVFCFIDLDQFKVINDTCGHIAGDALLKQVSRLIQQSLAESDVLARFGGDEFVLLMQDCSLTQAVQKLETVLRIVRELKFHYDDRIFNTTVSIGLVPVDNSYTLIDLLRHADSACYAAKEAGRDRLHVFSMHDLQLLQRSDEMGWVTRIQQALTENKLVLYSQPIVATSNTQNTISHCELLIRMQGEEGEIIAPGQFLPAAERYNLAAAIDLWTVENVVKHLTEVKAQGKNIAGIYGINLSGQSLGDPRFYEKIIQLISDSELVPTGAILCFEITETAAITNMHSAQHLIRELRKLGCLFALDDFGSGLSSFAYLKQLPIDYLKIDGMFVKDAASNRVNLEIVHSINSIGQVLGLKTVAEFVEDEATLASMQELGVDFVQGYKIGRPLPWQL